MLLRVVVMKKNLIYFAALCLLISLLFMGCNFTINKKKPSNYYYTNLLAKNLILSTSCKASTVDTNFYKKQTLTQDDVDTIKKFTKALNKKNFISCPKDLPIKPAYKIIIDFDKDKLVINVYNEKYISIYPWDGSYSMDYLNISDIEAGYNLFNLCKYLIPS